jgi:1,4-alpha-glucan branching enzyme
MNTATSMTGTRVDDWRPAPDLVDAIVTASHGDPFAVLGPHVLAPDALAIRAFAPGAERAEIIDRATGAACAIMERLDDRGFFAARVKGMRPDGYRLRLGRGSDTWEKEDVYRFPSPLGELDLYLIGEGTHRNIYEKLGAHPVTLDGVHGISFAVWAPNAARVSVVGEFNGWDGREHPMRRRHEAGVWDLFVPDLSPGALYKFEIRGPSGSLLPLKADPVSFAQELPPATASRVHGLIRRDWHDDAWLRERAARQAPDQPMSIYEVHLGSWRRDEHGAFFPYRRLAEELAGYVTDLGFTHIELLPVSEHPFSGSWGYQPIGLFAPTARFGTPDDFADFIEVFHDAGIGVLIDWVPAHFPNDAHGLAHFDGTALYEHEDPRLGLHRDWNTLIYNFGRREVANFLAANAIFWIDRYHLDGLRVDAVASMLYLDYSREPGEWVPNIHGGRENLDAIAFVRRMNQNVHEGAPGAITIAEESTAWPGVSRPVSDGGLGFSYKWNMGWMHDTLRYMSQDPVHRRHHHHDMTFGLLYAFSENFVLPLSHDEVVHGKGSLLAKMPGDRWQQFANLRAYLGFMWTHPGKKLLFMGGEFAQQREWNHDHGLDWHLLADADHRGVQSLVRDLNGAYRSLAALHEKDCAPEGFDWIIGDDADQSVFAFERRDKAGNAVVVLSNFTPVVRHNYRVGVPIPGRWREVVNSDDIRYGGSGVTSGELIADPIPAHGRPASIALTVPPLATVILEPGR